MKVIFRNSSLVFETLSGDRPLYTFNDALDGTAKRYLKDDNNQDVTNFALFGQNTSDYVLTFAFTALTGTSNPSNVVFEGASNGRSTCLFLRKQDNDTKVIYNKVSDSSATSDALTASSGTYKFAIKRIGTTMYYSHDGSTWDSWTINTNVETGFCLQKNVTCSSFKMNLYSDTSVDLSDFWS